MVWVAWGILLLMFLIVIGLFLEIVARQKKLDTPCKGVLIVDRQDPEAPCMVYLQVNVDPSQFKEGEDVKLKVRTVITDSQ